ncbi:hypothetical protein [Thermodesulfatator atlanticus]
MPVPFNSKEAKKTDQHKQLGLWDRPCLDPTHRIKLAMKEALRNTSLSREQVVDEMNRLAAAEGLTTNGRSQKVTLALLDKWLAPGATQHIIPLKLLPIFCTVTGSVAPLQALAAPLSAWVISAEEEKLLEWARLEVERRRLRKRARQLAQEVGIE